MPRFSPHNHTEMSNFRLLDCINKLPALVQRGKDIGLAGLAVTDHETVAQAIRICKLQKDNPDFKIGIGNEIYLVDKRESGQKYYHQILIAKDKIGFKQLRILSSLAWMNSYYDKGLERVPTIKEDLYRIVKENPGHLIATSACIGGELSNSVLEMEKARHIGDKETERIKYHQIINYMKLMDDLFGDDFYIEVAPGQSKDQIIVNNKLAQLSQVFKKKLVIGDDSHYLKKEDRYIHKAYLNSKGGERETDLFYEYSYLQDEDNLKENLAPSIGILYEDMCNNSMEMFDKIEIYDILHAQTIPSVPVKDYEKKDVNISYPTLKSLMQSDDIYDRYWVNECINVCKEKGFLTSKVYGDELEEEARVKKIIGEKLGTNMFKYPITLKYYIDMIWECGSLVGAGRGSSCAALNHYLLGITQLDPIKWELPFFRYLNEERVELGDIDIDICPSKKKTILKRIKEERGRRFINSLDEVSKKNLGCTLIATYGTEGTKSAILTACRGYRGEGSGYMKYSSPGNLTPEDTPAMTYQDGIDSDEASYMASLIPSERGFLWPIKDVINGNPEKGREPIYTFINEVNKYPGLMDIILGIEGLVNKRSSHASGVILFDEDPYEFGVFMKTPKGEIITQYDLHDCEAAGLTKYDFLVTEVQDKLAQAIRFLQADGVIEDNGINLRSVYDKYFHPNILPINNKNVWKAIQNNEVINVFQFDSVVGSQAAKKIKPTNILELTDANGLMRLMTAEKGAETPMEKYIRFKNNIKLWYNEMNQYGLSRDEMTTLEPYFKTSYGVPPSQEQMMKMLMDKNICNFSLGEANTARKIVGKKQMNKIPELREKVLSQAKSPALGRYIWNCGIGPQMGYSFSIIHALAYSFIGYQTAYIATKWNPIYWDAACLVVNSGSLEEDEEADVEKREVGTDYTKIAIALGDIINNKINISLVDINKSDYGFKPDVDNNQILFGLKALGFITSDVIEQIKAGRPYVSLKDFMHRCPLSKTRMINLIKGGAFDNLEEPIAKELGVHPRIYAMTYYLSIVSEPKKKLTLQNFNGLLERNIIPKELDFQRRAFIFNKYVKKFKDVKRQAYLLNWPKALAFYQNFFDTNKINVDGKDTFIYMKDWDNQYKLIMNDAREWLKNNQEKTLQTLNTYLFKEMWDKYAQGTLSHWEMESLCFYYHEHELANIDTHKYGIVNFFDLPTDPPVDYFFKRNNQQIPIFKLCRIAGTVIGKDDTRHIVSLLTTEGVVSVKLTRDYYAALNRQISDINENGEKKIMEKSWFTRGAMLLVNGFRRDDTFVAKKYKSTGGHQIYKIININGRNLELTHKRYGDKDE